MVYPCPSVRQLIRRSGDVLRFLCREGALSVEHLDIIWAAGGGGQDKDRRICVHEVNTCPFVVFWSLFCIQVKWVCKGGDNAVVFHGGRVRQSWKPPVFVTYFSRRYLLSYRGIEDVSETKLVFARCV